LHSDIDAFERVDILTRLRKGEFDCLIGINLLREGLDLPEVALVAVLDADKEGFLRSTTSLIQTAGRAARHVSGRVILYADNITDSIRNMMSITERRRAAQQAYNEEHGIIPRSASRALNEDAAAKTFAALDISEEERLAVGDDSGAYDLAAHIERLQREMSEAAAALEFERAAAIRDEIKALSNEGIAAQSPSI
jgi:excinuclease ABC subunit B